ncbi:MAG: hypothetical protein V1835_03745 [Candidatus Micrarchaeota archaeon]
MLYFYTLETELKNEEIISAIKNYKAIAIRPELALLEEFISFSFAKAQEDFRKKINVANAFQIEWLCRIGCSRNIDKAIAFCKFDCNTVGIASKTPIPGRILKRIGKEAKLGLNRGIEGEIMRRYSITESSLVKYPLEGLLMEKCVVSFLE